MDAATRTDRGPYGLGPEVGCFRLPHLRSIRHLLLAPVAMLFVLTGLVGQVTMWFIDWPASLHWLQICIQVLLVILTLFFGVVLGGLLQKAFLDFGMRLVAFEDGLVRVKGRSARIYRWDDMLSVAVTQNSDALKLIPSGPIGIVLQLFLRSVLYLLLSFFGYRFAFRIRWKGHRKLVVEDQVEGAHRLFGLVQRQALARFLPPALNAYERGRLVRFGPFAISQEGLTIRKRLYPWGEINSVSCDCTLFVVVLTNGKARSHYALSITPNFEMMLSLLQHALAQHGLPPLARSPAPWATPASADSVTRPAPQSGADEAPGTQLHTAGRAVEGVYTVTLDDYVAYMMHVSRRSKALWKRVWKVLAVPILGLLVATVILALNGLTVGAVVCAGIAVSLPAAYRALFQRWIVYLIRAHPQQSVAQGVIGPTRPILSNESLVEITEKARTDVSWREVTSIDETPQHLFIHIGDKGSAIIPRHAFEREEDFINMRDFIRARVREEVEPRSVPGA